MDRRDRLFALLGGIIIIMSAGAGLAFATGALDVDGDDDTQYIVEWFEMQAPTTSQPGTNTNVFDITLPEHNITQVSISLSWTDDELVSPFPRRDDLLTLRVEGPATLDDNVATETDTDGEITLTFDTIPVPVVTEPDRYEEWDDTNATGDWSITVTVDPRGLRDTGNDWTVVLSYSYYVGRLVEEPEES